MVGIPWQHPSDALRPWGWHIGVGKQKLRGAIPPLRGHAPQHQRRNVRLPRFVRGDPQCPNVLGVESVEPLSMSVEHLGADGRADLLILEKCDNAQNFRGRGIGQISEKLKREGLQVESNAGIVQQIAHCVEKAARIIVTQYGKELTQLPAAEKRLAIHCRQPRRDRRAFLLQAGKPNLGQVIIEVALMGKSQLPPLHFFDDMEGDKRVPYGWPAIEDHDWRSRYTLVIQA